MASNRTTTIDGLSDAIMDVLNEYDQEVNNLTPRAVRKVATRCRKDIQSAAAAKFNGSGYQSSWVTKVTNKSARDYAITVYSKKPGLPHLLEKGHIKVAHGHVLGRTPGRVHIKPAELKAIADIEKEIRRALK